MRPDGIRVNLESNAFYVNAFNKEQSNWHVFASNWIKSDQLISSVYTALNATLPLTSHATVRWKKRNVIEKHEFILGA